MSITESLTPSKVVKVSLIGQNGTAGGGPIDVESPSPPSSGNVLGTSSLSVHNSNHKKQRFAFSRTRLLFLVSAVMFSVFRAGQVLHNVRSVVLQLPLFGAGSSPPMVMASTTDRADRRTQNQLETATSNNTAANTTTLWEPKMQMSSQLPPPFTRNGTGAIVLFLHIPKTGASAVLCCVVFVSCTSFRCLYYCIRTCFVSLTHPVVVLSVSRGHNHARIF